jgi:hypothetical protein
MNREHTSMKERDQPDPAGGHRDTVSRCHEYPSFIALNIPVIIPKSGKAG